MKITATKRLRTCGNAIGVFITKEAKIFDWKVGDTVKITIEKVKENDTNLHVDNAARQGPEARNKGIHQES